MDRFVAMATFAKVVKHASFTAAGDELGISRALVSRHVSSLESSLGVRLLNRTTRSVRPTEAGELYVELCNRVLSEMRACEHAITTVKEGIEGRISILAPKWMGNFDISEAVADFCKQNPKISIQLQVGGILDKPHDFIDRGFDLCIHTRSIRNSDIMSKKVSEIDYVLVASPQYIAARGEPVRPADLLGHDCLVQPADAVWRFRDHEPMALKEASKFSSNSFLSLCTAAVSGLGITMLPRRVAGPDLANGSLRQVLASSPLETRPVYVVYAPGALPRKVRALVNFLSAWFRAQAQMPGKTAEVVRIYSDARVLAKAG